MREARGGNEGTALRHAGEQQSPGVVREGVPRPAARPVAVSIVTTKGYDAPAWPPFSHDTKRSRVPSRDQSGGPASQPKSVSLISEGSRAGAPTWRSQMSSELPGARYDGTGVFARCEW